MNSLIRMFTKNSDYSYQITRTVSRDKILKFFSFIKPENYGIELLRIGGKSDGGYLLPDDLVGLKSCFSPGVGNSIEFENALAKNYGIQSYLADPTIQHPNYIPVEMDFSQVGISYCTEKSSIYDMGSKQRKQFDVVSLEDFLNQKIPKNETDLLLQMDIENTEYLSLLSTKPEVLQRFRIIVVEFHSIPSIFEEKYFTEIIEPLFLKIKNVFYVAHIHANNGAEPIKILNYKIPHGIEVTFHNRNRVDLTNKVLIADCYNKLDEPSDPNKPEIKIDPALFTWDDS